MTNEQLAKAVRKAVTRGYDSYLEQLKQDEVPSEDQLGAIAQEAAVDIFKVIDGVPVASRVGASKLALVVAIRTALQIFNAAQRAELRAARRRRFSDN
jgi:hypothetical protein